jgi:hypothetical protein
MIELLLPYGFDTLEYSWVKATIGICTLADYSMTKKCQQAVTWADSRQHQPVVDLPLHHHPVLPLVVPLAEANSDDVRCRALDPVLEVVAADGPQITPDGAQHMVEPEEVDGWPHAYIHLIEIHEDRHQGDGV